MKKALILLLILCLFPLSSLAQPLPEYPYTFFGMRVASHDSDSLRWQVERTTVEKTACYVSKIWMADPGRQIGKATADWKQNVLDTAKIAARAPEASLIINASGYVTNVYRWIPDDYPGESSDYFFTPLGSLVITDGQVYRHLEGIPFYGLTLGKDGLHMHVGDDPAKVLAQNPSQSWSFYVECPVIQNHSSILDPDWRFTTTPAMRTIIAKMDENNYLVLTVTRQKSRGLTMQQCVDFLLDEFDPEWAYNLDGGPSSALFYRNSRNRLKPIWKNSQENVDIMTFSELPSQ